MLSLILLKSSKPFLEFNITRDVPFSISRDGSVNLTPQKSANVISETRGNVLYLRTEWIPLASEGSMTELDNYPISVTLSLDQCTLSEITFEELELTTILHSGKSLRITVYGLTSVPAPIVTPFKTII